MEFIAGVGIGSLPYDHPDLYWIFIEGRYFQYDYLDRYVLPHERNRTVVRLTVHKANLTVRNRQLINQGIDVEQVSRLTRSEVSRYEVEEGKRPGQSRVSGNSVQIFRPAVKKNETAKPKAFWEKEEAERKVPEIRVDDLEKRLSPTDLEQKLRDDQDKEMRLLEQSQEREEVELKKKLDDEEKLAGSSAEKEKIRKEAEVKASQRGQQTDLGCARPPAHPFDQDRVQAPRDRCPEQRNVPAEHGRIKASLAWVDDGQHSEAGQDQGRQPAACDSFAEDQGSEEK